MKKHWTLVVLVIYFLLQAVSLPRVGMTWDEPSSFFFGRASLHFYQTGDRGYLQESEWENTKRFGKDPFQYIFGEDVYPPFPFIVASEISSVFSEHLHLMNPITAHHLGLVLIGGLGVFAMYGIGIVLGWSSILSLGIALLYGTYPTIVAQMRNDAKDVPLMSMIVVFIFCVLKWIHSTKRGGVKNITWGVLTGVSFGLALASKPTAVIILPILAVWFFVSYLFFPSFRSKVGPLPRVIIPGAFLALLAILVFFLAWPWLWDNPVGKLTQVWQFFKVVGRGMPTLYMGTVYNAGVNLPWHYPLGILAFQTPLSVLVVGAIALGSPIYVALRKKDPLPLLFLLWIVIGMGRFFVPGVLIYAKVRHFIDVMPAFFVLIGIFLHSIRKLSFQRGSRKSMAPISENTHSVGNRMDGSWVKRGMTVSFLLLGSMLLEQGFVILTHFPYEPSYFNRLIGGTKTVADKKLFDIEYWASGVKDAMNYIDSVTPADHPVNVYACTMAHLALFYETPKVKVTSNAANASYTLVPNSASWFGGVASFMKDNHTLVYTVKRSGGEFCWVYKHTGYSSWNCGQETQMVYQRP